MGNVYDFMASRTPVEAELWARLESYQHLMNPTGIKNCNSIHFTKSASLSRNDQSKLLVSGLVASNGEFVLDPYYLLESGSMNNLPTNGDILIQLLGSNNELLYQGGLSVSAEFANTELPRIEVIPIVVTIPFPTETRIIVVSLFGQEIERRIISPDPPTTNILSPQPGQKVDQPINISWQSSDPNGDQVYNTILLSADGGQNWQTMALDVEGSEYTSESLLPSSDSYWIKLISTDGVRVSTVTSGPFIVTLEKIYVPLVLK